MSVSSVSRYAGFQLVTERHSKMINNPDLYSGYREPVYHVMPVYGLESN